ncbi:MAG TPA: hypothetical protein DGR79_02385 [Clostridiales bacterium]|nr:hypothetical protein [Clostridiales bacterium]
MEFPKTHAIEQLLDLPKQVDAETVLSLKDAAVPTPYGIDIRYPGDQPEPNQEETREAIGLAWRVRDAVMGRVGEFQ